MPPPRVPYYNYDDMKYPCIGKFFVKYEIKIKDSINYEYNINKLTYISKDYENLKNPEYLPTLSKNYP